MQGHVKTVCDLYNPPPSLTAPHTHSAIGWFEQINLRCVSDAPFMYLEGRWECNTLLDFGAGKGEVAAPGDQGWRVSIENK